MRPAINPLLIVVAAAAVLVAMGRPLICTCGHVALWHGTIDAGNSQHLLDWYSPSHVIHGFLFYALGHLLIHRPIADRLLAALAIEATWEVIENSPAVIDRYRTATIALGYTGDSVVNSMADIACMTFGFWLARRLPPIVTAMLALLFEGVTLYTIRDNLTLNVVMLVWPVEAIRQWQAG